MRHPSRSPLAPPLIFPSTIIEGGLDRRHRGARGRRCRASVWRLVLVACFSFPIPPSWDWKEEGWVLKGDERMRRSAGRGGERKIK